MSQLTFNLQPEKRIYTVSDLTARIRDLLAKNFTDICVEGEISNCRSATSGHYLFHVEGRARAGALRAVQEPARAA